MNCVSGNCNQNKGGAAALVASAPNGGAAGLVPFSLPGFPFGQNNAFGALVAQVAGRAR